ncbi:hypothetical protein GALMADRAFT_139810 [Galerina marginata CBS 339.88]|uniref:Uncharacterized protein n=1 Tax=Galerina marginata (strain CBS 339.88) TaxID=685588 RepID=A0A067T823_GALM3|nr:hypothetical protein GALMADRAFT_139810 [Galerina marginata CBS 339.88]
MNSDFPSSDCIESSVFEERELRIPPTPRTPLPLLSNYSSYEEYYEAYKQAFNCSPFLPALEVHPYTPSTINFQPIQSSPSPPSPTLVLKTQASPHSATKKRILPGRTLVLSKKKASIKAREMKMKMKKAALCYNGFRQETIYDEPLAKSKSSFDSFASSTTPTIFKEDWELETGTVEVRLEGPIQYYAMLLKLWWKSKEFVLRKKQNQKIIIWKRDELHYL